MELTHTPEDIFFLQARMDTKLQELCDVVHKKMRLEDALQARDRVNELTKSLLQLEDLDLFYEKKKEGDKQVTYLIPEGDVERRKRWLLSKCGLADFPSTAEEYMEYGNKLCKL